MPELLETPLNSNDLLTTLEVMYSIRQPAMVWGPPGIGKSRIMKQLSKRLGIALKDVRALLMNPVDVNGLPHVLRTKALIELEKMIANGTDSLENVAQIFNSTSEADIYGKTVWSRPGFLPSEGKGILLFDELTAAAVEVQAALYQVMLDYAIGDHKLAEGWVPFAAGNRITDRGVAHKMPTPLADRMFHFDLVVEFEPWMDWAVANDIHPLVISYIKFSLQDHADDSGVGMLHRFDPKANERSFPTPRSWEKVSEAVKELEVRDMTGTRIEEAIIAGKVGATAAKELMAYAITFRQGFSIDGVMRNPDTMLIPDEPSMRCAVAAALARAATRVNIDRIGTYMDRLPEEYQMLFTKTATARDATLNGTHWITKFDIRSADITA